MKINVIVLNYNSLLLLGDCLAALQKCRVESAAPHPQIELCVVDNASPDSPRPFLRQNFPAVKLIENPSNRGFGAGNNSGIRQSDGDFIVLVNPDVVVARNFLTNLLTPFADPTIGIVGSKLHYPASNVIQHAGGYLTAPRALPYHYGIGEVDNGQHDTPREVEYVIGAAIALRRTMLDEIGLFDESFFLFFEEADLCVRARAADWKVWYQPTAVATHIESAIIGKRSFFYYQQFHKSRVQFAIKHFSAQELRDLVATEIHQLPQTEILERLAMQLAYQKMLTITDSSFVQAEMKKLLAVAVQAVTLTFAPSADIIPPTFHSKWPLIARLRHLWNRVAARPYTQAHFAQQIEFNHAVVKKMMQNDRLIEQQRARIGRLSAEISRAVEGEQ